MAMADWRYEAEPQLYEVKGGWHAAGRGWAVFGETREQAIERFHEAVAKHMEIDARPMPQRPREAGDAL